MGVIRELRSDIEAEAIRLLSECFERLKLEAVSLCANEVEAEDLVFRTIETFLQHSENYDSAKGSRLVYLKGILRRIHHDSTRGKARASVVYLDPDDLAIRCEAMSECGGEDTPLSDDESALLRRTVGRLPPKMREVIVLHYFEGLSLMEIARNLRVSEGSVKSRLHYARKVLAQRLKKSGLGKGILVASGLMLFGLAFAAVRLAMPGESVPLGPGKAVSLEESVGLSHSFDVEKHNQKEAGMNAMIKSVATGTLAAAMTQGPAQADALVVGDAIEASVFHGVEEGSSSGNPASNGQGWYLRDIVTPLKWYSSEITSEKRTIGDRWASEASDPSGTYVRYSHVYDLDGKLHMYDRFNGKLGVAWVYTAPQLGTFRLEADSWKFGSYSCGQVMVRMSLGEPWMPLTEELSVSNIQANPTNFIFTADLGAGGGFAVKFWNNCKMVSAASAEITGLRVRYLGAPTEPACASVEVSSNVLEENDALEVTPCKSVTFRLSRASSETVTVTVGGSAVGNPGIVFDASPVVFAPGTMTVVRALRAVDNVALDGDRDLNITLSSVTGAVMSPADSVTIRVLDDEKPMANKGDSVLMNLFMGTELGTSGGNPSPSGQGWYKYDMATDELLNVYAPSGTNYWATSETAQAQGNNWAYAKVSNTVNSDYGMRAIDLYDAWYGRVGLSWRTTVPMSGTYELSGCVTSRTRMNIIIYRRDSAKEPWVAIATNPTKFAYTNDFRRGGGYAVQARHDGGAAAGSARIVGTKVRCLANTPGLFIIVR